MDMNLPQKSDFLFYSGPDGKQHLEVFVADETIWLTQKNIAELFDVDVRTVSEHLQNVFNEKELGENSTIRKFRIVQKEGDRDVERDVNLYNLDGIISVGYRVSSARATHFRQWATKTLREYMIKGFAIDDDRLKQTRTTIGIDYFHELLERIRSIRASEQRIWLQITDIFAETSSDYDVSSQAAKDFFAMIQNKFHFAITGRTAAEIIAASADSTKPKMGLKTYKNSPEGRVIKSDVTVAKNYLQETDIKKLERTVGSFFDYIENLVENRTNFTMTDFTQTVDKFLSFNEFKVLDSKGSITANKAKELAEGEYDKFNKDQALESDFKKYLKDVGGNK